MRHAVSPLAPESLAPPHASVFQMTRLQQWRGTPALPEPEDAARAFPSTALHLLTVARELRPPWLRTLHPRNSPRTSHKPTAAGGDPRKAKSDKTQQKRSPSS